MENENVWLGFIVDKTTPFIEKYPEHTGRISTMFLHMITSVKIEGIKFMSSALPFLEELRLKLENSVKEKAGFAMMWHNIDMAVMSLAEMSKSELKEVEKYFEELKGSTKSLETFLRKELNIVYNSERQIVTNYVSGIFDMLTSGERQEDFVLYGKIEKLQLKQAIEKYFNEANGKVNFDDADLSGFDYTTPERNGMATLTIGPNAVYITVT